MRELRRTAYKHVKTDVLSSREHTCIHPKVSKMLNKNEGCQQLNDPNQGGPGCKYYHGANKIKTHDRLSQTGIQPAWDIEDLVTLGKKIGSCPYFAARALKETAEVIFCPYNYLIDPIVRDTMSIELRGQIIVLDEAHNIEDSARESTSCSVKQSVLLEGVQDLQKLVELEFCAEECKTLSQMLSALSGWIDVNKENLTDYKEFDRSGKIFTGTEMIAHLDNLQIGQDRFEELKKCFSTVTAEQDPEENSPRLKTHTSMLLKALFLMYHFLLLDDMKYRDDYRIALVKVQTRRSGKQDSGGYYSKRFSIDWEYSINFWCLNPGIAFLSVGAGARSIILTSGTLSPMSSFQSELGVPFPIQLEANHVIDKNQVWVGTVGRGPTDQTLQATYRNVETWEFQDELGRLVLNVCKAIPHGVLCFLPSYSMLNKLLDRWQSTGMWNELSQIKVAVTEPRKGDEFEAAMSLFYDTIEDTKEVKKGCDINGAFFMAVCRGKVSEGLDFTDDNARAVIAVGIPFPNVKDIQVDLKRQYNNKHCQSRGLLPGSEWYEIQAYRALNQALGRCIRHRYDWGALILVDERFQRGRLAGEMQQTKYTRGLSKWVRNKIVHHYSFSVALSNLGQFAENMIANPPVRPESLEDSLIVDNHSSSTQKEVPSCDTIKQDVTSSENIPTVSGFNADLPSESDIKNRIHSSESTSNQSDCFTVPASTQLETSTTEIQEFSTSIVGGLNHNLEDSDFCTSDEELVIPPSRIRFTSTQMLKDKTLSSPSKNIPHATTELLKNGSASNNFTKTPLTSTQIPGQGDGGFVFPDKRVPFTSTQISQLREKDLNLPCSIPIISTQPQKLIEIKESPAVISHEHAEESPVKADHGKRLCSSKSVHLLKNLSSVNSSCPSRKRKSFSLSIENETEFNTPEMELKKSMITLSANDNYMGCTGMNDKSNVLPLKDILENEIDNAPVDEENKRLIGGLESNFKQKKNSEIEPLSDESRLSMTGKCSSQAYDSDEDLFADASPVKTIFKSHENKKPISETVLLSSTTNGREVFTKEISHKVGSSALTKTPDDSRTLQIPSKIGKLKFMKDKHQNLDRLETKSQVGAPDDLTRDDSDLDDFCMNKSFNTPRAKKIRRQSKGKSTGGIT